MLHFKFTLPDTMAIAHNDNYNELAELQGNINSIIHLLENMDNDVNYNVQIRGNNSIDTNQIHVDINPELNRYSIIYPSRIVGDMKVFSNDEYDAFICYMKHIYIVLDDKLITLSSPAA